MTPASPTLHAAVITVTGWPTVLPDGIRIHGLHVRTAWRPGETPGRVTVRLRWDVAAEAERQDGPLRQPWPFIQPLTR